MLPECHKIGVTYFPKPKRYNTGWRVEVRKENKVVKTRYALTYDDAVLIRTQFINEFWGKSLN